MIPSLGQIVEGHLLIAPSRHFRALADLPQASLQELDILYGNLRSTLTRLYGRCVFFEHGIRCEASGGCGIDHAHLHAVPVRADGVLEILSQRFRGVPISSISNINECIPVNVSYLFFEDASSQRLVFPVGHLPSQYMRQLIASSIGKKAWDWRGCGREPELLATMQQLDLTTSALNCTE